MLCMSSLLLQTILLLLNPCILQYRKQKQKAEHITGPTLAEQYIVIADYMKADKWDLPLKAGMILEVVEKSDSGRCPYQHAK